MTTQDDIFARSEGDRWFERNGSTLNEHDPDADIPLRLAEMYGMAPSSVLEIGAANGYRLQAFKSRYRCRVVGVDASAAAIADGRARFPNVELHRGRADRLPVREEFDLVVVNFVFHWVDRRNLLRSIAELDRTTRDGGFVILGDFQPDAPVMRPYHHLADRRVFTFKQDYAAILMSTGMYRAVALLTSDHTGKMLTARTNPDDRVGTWLLAKDLTGLYIDPGAPA